jgi:hypothetical protein
MSRRNPRPLGERKKKGAGSGRPTDPRDDAVLLDVARRMVWEQWPEDDVLRVLRRIFLDYESDAEAKPLQRLRDRFEREREIWLDRARQAGPRAAVLDPSFSDDRSHAPQYEAKAEGKMSTGQPLTRKRRP